MIWNIVADSSCDLHSLPVKAGDDEIRFVSVPFIITVGKTDFVDDDSVDRDGMVDAMEQEKTASHTTCPAPAAWV
ncbi:MAG: DegV family protein, partial [Oscillospiraceae bacterium]|nr:DegV family protein [Oscillospiraceae bacterium]